MALPDKSFTERPDSSSKIMGTSRELCKRRDLSPKPADSFSEIPCSSQCSSLPTVQAVETSHTSAYTCPGAAGSHADDCRGFVLVISDQMAMIETVVKVLPRSLKHQGNAEHPMMGTIIP